MKFSSEKNIVSYQQRDFSYGRTHRGITTPPETRTHSIELTRNDSCQCRIIMLLFQREKRLSWRTPFRVVNFSLSYEVVSCNVVINLIGDIFKCGEQINVILIVLYFPCLFFLLVTVFSILFSYFSRKKLTAKCTGYFVYKKYCNLFIKTIENRIAKRQ